MSGGGIRRGFLVREVLVRGEAECSAEHGDGGAGAPVAGEVGGSADEAAMRGSSGSMDACVVLYRFCDQL